MGSKNAPVTIIYTESNPNVEVVTVIEDTPSNRQKVDTWRNHPQILSLMSGYLIFIAGGLQLALGLGWTETVYDLDFLFSWFIGVAAGAIIAAPLITVLPKRVFMFFSALLVIAEGIIFIAAPYQLKALLAARYVSGFGIGFAMIPFIVHASEITVRSNRGFCLSLEQFGMTIGIVIQVIYSSQWTDQMSFAEHRVHGIFTLAAGLLSLVANFSIIESPVYYLRKCDDTEALECLRRLRSPHIVSNETRSKLAELKSYVMENEQLTFCGSFVQGLSPLIKMIFYRGIAAFTIAMPLQYAAQVASTVVMGYSDNWIPIVSAVLLLVGAMIALHLFDSAGRKAVSLFALLVLAGFTIGIGVVFSKIFNVLIPKQMSTVCILSMIGQIFNGIYAPSSTVYLGEAFPLLVKPYFIAFCVVVQQVVHIVVICVYDFGSGIITPYTIDTHQTYVFSITVGVIMFVGFVCFCVVIPETKVTTLKTAQNRFRRILNLEC